MLIRVNGKRLKSVFADFVKNNKIMFNFRVVGDNLHIQVLGDYTVCTHIPCEILQSDSETEVSVWVTKSTLILSEKEDMLLAITTTGMTITQDNASCMYTREYEARREFPDISNIPLENAFANRLKYLVHSAISCNCMAKELSISNPDPIFSGNKFYVDYRQAIFVDNMEYPECCIPISTLKDFVFKLDEKTQYAYLHEYNTMYFYSGNYEFWISTANYNIDSSTINAINGLMSGLTDVSKITLKEDYDSLSIIPSAFPKQKLVLSVCEDGISVIADSVTSHITVGSTSSKYLFMLHITSAQLEAILKLFDKEEEITIRRGASCICLTSREKNLLIAGLIC